MKIGIVVHGPFIVDSGHAEEILNLLHDYGLVEARLGGTMGRTAVHDAGLEDKIDISMKLLPSQSIDKFVEEKYDVVILINYGKSSLTGHAFGFKVFNHCHGDPPLIQIERPGERDGSIIPWTRSLNEIAGKLSKDLNLKIVYPHEIKEKMNSNKVTETERTIAGVSLGENIIVNGVVIGKSISCHVTLIAEDGYITEIKGANIKEHGVEKLGKINLKTAIVKTGLLRRSDVSPRIVKTNNKRKNFKIAFLNHTAEDIYKFKSADYVVTIGDDTTLVAGDILYRFDVPVIGITDGDIDKVVENGFKTKRSFIIELERGLDDLIGKKIHSELFNGEEIIEIQNIENFKKEILQIINDITTCYKINEN